MYRCLRNKKLLVIGSSEVDANIVRAAQEMGVYTIAVDGNKKTSATFAKNIADESWDIDYTKTAEIGEKCKAEGVDGVIAGYSEFRVSAASRIAEYIGTPFYATENQIELTRNKRRFKDECRKYGITVPKDIAENEGRFPVIVKPVDAAGRKGISICLNHEQLTKAIVAAKEYSNNIIVEEYISGTEFSAIYTMQDGVYSLSCFNEKYLNQESPCLCDLALTPSIYLDRYLETTDQRVKQFLHGIGVRNGVTCFQGIVAEEDIYIFEMGYRLNGGNDYFIVEKENGISYMKMLIAYSLTGKMIGDLSKDNPHFSKYYANYLIYSHGGRVGRIGFLGDCNKKGIGDIHIKKAPGMTVKEDATTQQCAFTFKLIASSLMELEDLIGYCKSHVIMKNDKGENMLFSPCIHNLGS